MRGGLQARNLIPFCRVGSYPLLRNEFPHRERSRRRRKRKKQKKKKKPRKSASNGLGRTLCVREGKRAATGAFYRVRVKLGREEKHYENIEETDSSVLAKRRNGEIARTTTTPGRPTNQLSATKSISSRIDSTSIPGASQNARYLITRRNGGGIDEIARVCEYISLFLPPSSFSLLPLSSLSLSFSLSLASSSCTFSISRKYDPRTLAKRRA